MNSVVNDFNAETTELSFKTTDDVLEAHQVMINQLRSNLLRVGGEIQNIYKMLEQLYNTLEKNKIEMAELNIPKQNSE